MRSESGQPPHLDGAPAKGRDWRYRIRGGWRCKVGIHRLRGHIDCGDSINVAPYDPRTPRPERFAWRVCTWCGAQWVASYDGVAPYWRRSA